MSYFGAVAVSADGGTLAVGAHGEDGGASGVNGNQADSSARNSGAVYVFRRIGTTWHQEAYIKAPDSDPEDAFGIAVALSADGDTLAIGAVHEDTAVAHGGRVHIFRRTGTVWAQEASVHPRNPGVDRFGHCLALSADGDTLAAGAPFEASSSTQIDGDQTDNSAWRSGAVYIFRRRGSIWDQEAYIKASNSEGIDWVNYSPGQEADELGWSVALSSDGDVLAVGAHNEGSGARGIDGDQTDNSARHSGAVYVFRRTGSRWEQEAYIKASNSGPGDRFGVAVALSADAAILAVGAWLEDSGLGVDQTDESAEDSGAVYIFARRGRSWTQQAYLKAPNADAGDHFGGRVALSGEGALLAVGSTGESSHATGVDGDLENDDAPESGAVYLFRRSGDTWAFRAYLKASNTGPGDIFGWGVSFSADGTTLAVGAGGEDSIATGVDGEQADNSAENSGAVYVFRQSWPAP